ncbi:hypothetical protein RSOLAG22IIIB_03639 [Rhizoctonia solani]|uniref:DUF6534 domain-containing protein n=1 Tax=Rhizoctonia solani TaxID=456999 RepID=A0A0K6FS07_9AGAM|nr:hypothetical protein RSOLAG22IIIB_03639 [Rhizoctonia solani]
MGVISLADLDQIAAPVLSADKSFQLGPFIVASFVDTLFCGFLLMQCGAYVTLGRNDPSLFKWMVAYVSLLNIASTVFTWTWIYDLFVYNFGSYGLFLSIKYLSWFYVLDSMIVIVVQAFFGLRAWKLTGKSWLVGLLLVTLMLSAFGGGIAIKVLFTRLGSTLYAKDVRVPAYICLFCTVAADITITAIILRYLTCNHMGIQTTDHMLTRLARVTFSSQLPPTLIAIALAIEFSIKYDSFIAIPFICVQGKVYGISLLHTLNVRESWRRPDHTNINATDSELQQPSQPTVWKVNPTRTSTQLHRDTQLECSAGIRQKQWPSQKDDTSSGKTSSVNVDVRGAAFELSHFGAGLDSQSRLSHEKSGASVSPMAC